MAVAFVVLAHTGGQQFQVLGPHGVSLFFVLSAYLITGILLRLSPQPRAFGAFYARRALRIVPAYYLLLIVLVVVDVPGMRETWLWHAAYASNWRVAVSGRWGVAIEHLWTLAVEEQFYLTWPFVVLLAPRHRLGTICVALATSAVVARGMLAILSPDPQRAITPTFAVLDTLAVGALLALHPLSTTARRLTLGVGLSVVAAALVARTTERGYVPLIATERLGAALVSLWLVDRAAVGALPRLFAWRPVRALGTISYGVYLWHMPIAYWVRVWAREGPFAERAASGGAGMLIVVSVLTLTAASLSWAILEHPLNQLKRFVTYPRLSRDDSGSGLRHARTP